MIVEMVKSLWLGILWVLLEEFIIDIVLKGYVIKIFYKYLYFIYEFE